MGFCPVGFCPDTLYGMSIARRFSESATDVRQLVYRCNANHCCQSVRVLRRKRHSLGITQIMLASVSEALRIQYDTF